MDGNIYQVYRAGIKTGADSARLCSRAGITEQTRGRMSHVLSPLVPIEQRHLKCSARGLYIIDMLDEGRELCIAAKDFSSIIGSSLVARVVIDLC